MPDSSLDLCRFCMEAPTDWCPGCLSPLCQTHSEGHHGSFDERCTQGGPMYAAEEAERLRLLEADALDREGVPIGRLGLTNDGGASLHRCVDCRRVFTVTPPASINWGLGCLADECGSYDIARDVDTFFEPAAEAGLIQREST